jgi:ribonucleotide monophosphatase NagD (HAD superfamily)
MGDQKTIFCDIDGCLIEHQNFYNVDMKPVDGTLETIKEWDRAGHRLILTTGRRESSRKITEEQLSKVGIFYDKLIMGIGGGSRVLINDRKPNNEGDTATAFNLDRNSGIKGLDI